MKGEKGVEGVNIPEGKKVTLSRKTAKSLGFKPVILRPLTAVALKTASGIRTTKPARLKDKKAFEIRDSMDGLVELKPDKKGQIGGVKASYLRALITRIEEKDPIPKTVRIEKKRREWYSHKIGFPIQGPTKEELIELAHIVKIYELMIPEFVTGLMTCLMAYVAEDIYVGSLATLILDETVTAISARNCHVHDGGRIIQKAPYLTVDLSGEMKGLI